MTGLLVSVRDASEARAAVEAGAHLIDVKEPRAGSLGAAELPVIAEILRTVAGRRPVSVALGELAEGVLDLRPLVAEHRLSPAIRFAKIGLAGCASRRQWPERWKEALARLPAEVAAVAVLYADSQAAQSPPAADILAEGRRLGCRAMLIDTFDKRGPGLLGHLSLAELAEHVAAARDAEMIVVLGGRVEAEQLDELLPLRPDFIAVRGAVCRGDRSGQLDADRVRWLTDRLGQTEKPARTFTA
jgi:(5-formylfuran-3-yl)methyl phosphate synthase